MPHQQPQLSATLHWRPTPENGRLQATRVAEKERRTEHQNFKTSMLMPSSDADGVCAMSFTHEWDTRDDFSDGNYPRNQCSRGLKGTNFWLI